MGNGVDPFKSKSNIITGAALKLLQTVSSITKTRTDSDGDLSTDEEDMGNDVDFAAINNDVLSVNDEVKQTPRISKVRFEPAVNQGVLERHKTARTFNVTEQLVKLPEC